MNKDIAEFIDIIAEGAFDTEDERTEMLRDIQELAKEDPKLGVLLMNALAASEECVARARELKARRSVS
jgi:hypothetical protein